MSVKKMVDLYLNYGLDERTWNMLYEMTCHGIIPADNWRKFHEKCADWSFSEDGNEVLNAYGDVLYHYDDNGYLVKNV